jgi:hypothetical protein
MREVVCVLIAVAIVAGVGTARSNEIVINGIDAKISYLDQKNSRESDLGFGLGIGLFNIYGFMGMHYDVLYKTFDYRSYTYDDLTYKGHVRLKYPAEGATSYLGFGWGYRKFWLREEMR